MSAGQSARRSLARVQSGTACRKCLVAGWGFATDLAWELKSPETLPYLRRGADERKKEKR